MGQRRGDHCTLASPRVPSEPTPSLQTQVRPGPTPNNCAIRFSTSATLNCSGSYSAFIELFEGLLRIHFCLTRGCHPSRGLDRKTPRSQRWPSSQSQEYEMNRAGRRRSHPNGRRRPGRPPAPPFSFTPRLVARFLGPPRTRRAR